MHVCCCFPVQPPYDCSFQLFTRHHAHSHTLQVLMHICSLMQVAPELSPPPPPPGTVAVNITGGNNGSSPIVTVNPTVGPASLGASPIVEQPPLASPLAPTGGHLSHRQLNLTVTLSHSYGIYIMLFCSAEVSEQVFFILLACLVHECLLHVICYSSVHKAVQAATWAWEVVAE